MSTAVNPNRHVQLHRCGHRHDMRLVCPATNLLPERFAVEVITDDIAQGWPCSGSKCPIALAIMRWLRKRGINFVAVTVTDRDVEINLNWHTPALRYWHDSVSLVLAVDHGEPVEPRTVVLARLSR